MHSEELYKTEWQTKVPWKSSECAEDNGENDERKDIYEPIDSSLEEGERMS